MGATLQVPEGGAGFALAELEISISFRYDCTTNHSGISRTCDFVIQVNQR